MSEISPAGPPIAHVPLQVPAPAAEPGAPDEPDESAGAPRIVAPMVDPRAATEAPVASRLGHTAAVWGGAVVGAVAGAPLCGWPCFVGGASAGAGLAEAGYQAVFDGQVNTKKAFAVGAGAGVAAAGLMLGGGAAGWIPQVTRGGVMAAEAVELLTVVAGNHAGATVATAIRTDGDPQAVRDEAADWKAALLTLLFSPLSMPVNPVTVARSVE